MAAAEAVGGWAEQGLASRYAVGHHVKETANADAEQEEDGCQYNLQLNTTL